MVSFSLDNPVISGLIYHSALMTMKMMLMSFLTANQRISKGVSIYHYHIHYVWFNRLYIIIIVLIDCLSVPYNTGPGCPGKTYTQKFVFSKSVVI